MAGMAPGATAYSLTARVLHWLTAALVLTMIPAGIVMVNIGSGALQDFLFNLHRSLGVALIPVILLRLAYRLINPPPPLPERHDPARAIVPSRCRGTVCRVQRGAARLHLRRPAPADPVGQLASDRPSRAKARVNTKEEWPRSRIRSRPVSMSKARK